MNSFYFRYVEDSDVYYWGNLKKAFINTTVEGSPWHKCTEHKALERLRSQQWVITDQSGNILEES